MVRALASRARVRSLETSAWGYYYVALARCLPCHDGFFSGFLVFPQLLPQKRTLQLQFDMEILNGMWNVSVQIPNY